MTAKRKPPTTTTPAMVMAVLRRYVWLRSPERTAALKATDNHCTDCGGKFTRRKGFELPPNVHHLDCIKAASYKGITLRMAIDAIIHIMTPDPSRLVALCKECHLVRHEKEKV